MQSKAGVNLAVKIADVNGDKKEVVKKEAIESVKVFLNTVIN